jgi:hypothetical protein
MVILFEETANYSTSMEAIKLSENNARRRRKNTLNKLRRKEYSSRDELYFIQRTDEGE